jgi:hypothetical protein
MDKDNLNELAIERMKALTDNGYLEAVRIIDQRMSQHSDPEDKSFYKKMQDEANEACGEITSAYYDIRAEVKRFVAVRKFQMKMELESNKQKVPGNEVLEDLAKAEIPELYRAYIILEGWKERANNTVMTARNHTYGNQERKEPGEKNESN